MRIVWTTQAINELAHELSGKGRPTPEHFNAQLRGAVELTFLRLWDDPSKVEVFPSGIRATATTIAPPYMFPPGVVYARKTDEETIEIVGIVFDWDYWETVDDGLDD